MSDREIIELTGSPNDRDPLLNLHDFHAGLPRQFDAIIHFDETMALEPLERWPIEHAHEAPETHPSTL